MSLPGGGCLLPYPCGGSISLNAMAVINSVCNQFHAVNGSGSSQQRTCKKVNNVEVKENGSSSFVPKQYSSETLTPAGSSLQNPAVILYPREKIWLHWHEAIPKREPVGLWNAGNSCFLNSVLQCLTFTPPLANFFMFEGHKRKCDSNVEYFVTIQQCICDVSICGTSISLFSFKLQVIITNMYARLVASLVQPK